MSDTTGMMEADWATHFHRNLEGGVSISNIWSDLGQIENSI